MPLPRPPNVPLPKLYEQAVEVRKSAVVKLPDAMQKELDRAVEAEEALLPFADVDRLAREIASLVR